MGKGNPLRVSWRAMAAIAVLGISAGAASLIAEPATAAARPTATRYSIPGELSAVAAASAANAWAVGSAGSKVLMLHWNGSTWK